MDPERPTAEAMLVHGERIALVGDLAEVIAAAPEAPIEEVAGVVLPGFIDSHVHTLIVGLERRRLTISEASSVAEVVERIRDWLAANPGLDWAVIGAHFQEEDLAEGRLPDRHDLDPISGGTALYLDRRTHDAIVNTAALHRAGIDRDTPDPDGGSIEHDPDGEPNGILIERPAADLVFRVIPAIDRDELHASLLEGQQHLHANGVTSAAEPGLTPLEMSVYQEAWRRGTLTMRTMAMPLYVPDDGATAFLDGLGTATGFGDERLRIGPIKVYFDGTGGFNSALIDRDWPGFEPGYRGNQVCDTESFRVLAEHCASRGWAMAVHTVGGDAVRIVLDVLEEVDRRHPIRDLRFSVMHAYLWPTEATMARAARLGVLLANQPGMTWRVGANIVRKFGAEAETIAPLRSWFDAGVTVAGGSDGPDFPMSPLFGMWQARTRLVRDVAQPLGPRLAITPAEALEMWTTNAARYCFAETDRGSLEAGKLADWVEVDLDPATASDAELAAARVLRTVVGGRTVFAAGGDAGN